MLYLIQHFSYPPQFKTQNRPSKAPWPKTSDDCPLPPFHPQSPSRNRLPHHIPSSSPPNHPFDSLSLKPVLSIKDDAQSLFVAPNGARPSSVDHVSESDLPRPHSRPRISAPAAASAAAAALPRGIGEPHRSRNSHAAAAHPLPAAHPPLPPAERPFQFSAFSPVVPTPLATIFVPAAAACAGGGCAEPFEPSTPAAHRAGPAAAAAMAAADPFHADWPHW
jgi:hypothetical protein